MISEVEKLVDSLIYLICSQIYEAILTLLFFHREGNLPVLILRLSIFDNVGEILGAEILRILAPMVSRPAAVVLIDCSSLSTNSEVKGLF